MKVGSWQNHKNGQDVLVKKNKILLSQAQKMYFPDYHRPNSGGSTGVIIGILVGTAVLLVILVFVIASRKNSSPSEKLTSNFSPAYYRQQNAIEQCRQSCRQQWASCRNAYNRPIMMCFNDSYACDAKCKSIPL